MLQEVITTPSIILDGADTKLLSDCQASLWVSAGLGGVELVNARRCLAPAAMPVGSVLARAGKTQMQASLSAQTSHRKDPGYILEWPVVKETKRKVERRRECLRHEMLDMHNALQWAT